MKTQLLLIVLTAFVCQLNAQDEQVVEMCNYFGGTPKLTKKEICKKWGYASEDAAEEVVKDIMDQLGLQPNFIVLECNKTPNAAALVDSSDIGLIRYIMYNKYFMQRVKAKTKTDWGAMSIMAHEIGHHLNGHTLDRLGSRPTFELESDEFSGFALFKLGASLEEAQAAINNFVGEKGGPTHPGRADRLAAIEKGWKNAASLAPKYRFLSRNADYTSNAKEWFQKAYSLDGDDLATWENKVAYYLKATEFRADYEEAYRNAARYLNKLGQHQKAIQEANRAISLNRESWNAYNEKAAAYYSLGQFKRAKKYFSWLIDNRENAHDYYGRGSCYLKLGDKTQAATNFQVALKLDPGLIEAKEKLNEATN